MFKGAVKDLMFFMVPFCVRGGRATRLRCNYPKSLFSRKTIDVQCCFGGYYNDKVGSVAIELLVATQKELSIQFLLKCLEDI